MELLSEANTNAVQRRKEVRDAQEAYNRMGCFERIAILTQTALVGGALMGAVEASWSEASHVGVVRST